MKALLIGQIQTGLQIAFVCQVLQLNLLLTYLICCLLVSTKQGHLLSSVLSNNVNTTVGLGEC